MKLRCKSGDLALVVYDEPGCENNIGRLLRVRGPAEFSPYYELTTWEIKPVNPVPWAVVRDEGVVQEKVTWRKRIEHPDAWLVPLRPGDLDDKESSGELVPKPEVCDVGA